MHRSSRLSRLLALSLALSLNLPSLSFAVNGPARNTPGAKTGMVRMPGLAHLVKTGSVPANFKVQVTPTPGAPKDLKAIETAKTMTADSKAAKNEAVQKAAFEGGKAKAQEQTLVDASQASGAAPSGLKAAPGEKSAEGRASVPAAFAASSAASALKPAKRGFGFGHMIKAAAFALVAAIVPGCGGSSSDDYYIPAPVDPTYIRYAGNGHPLATWPYDSVSELDEADLAYYINNHRASLGLPALTISSLMGDAARADALHQSMHGYTGIYNPEGDGPTQRADMVGIPYWYYTSTSQAGLALVTAWDAFNEILYWDWAMIEDPFLTHMGVGRRYDAASPWLNHWTVDLKEE